MDDKFWPDDVAPTSALAAFTAHEVRNPLAALRAMAQLTLTSVDPEIRRVMLEQIVVNIDELDQFLRQMLAIVRPGAVTMQKVDVAAVLRNAVRLFAVQADQQGVDMQLQLSAPTPVAWGNPDLLRHVFINLLKNALEAMPEGGSIVVSASQCESHGTVQVKVRDRGPGIPKPLRAGLLNEFTATGRNEGGGIGLPFVNKVVRDLHGGHVTFTTKTGIGTVFRIEIPGVCPRLGLDPAAFSKEQTGSPYPEQEEGSSSVEWAG